MLLSIKEMEVRKVPFASSWQPGDIDFTGTDVRQADTLRAEGVAELLPHTGGEVRVTGRIQTDLETECDRCLGRALFHIDVPFDLFYMPASTVKKAEEDEIADHARGTDAVATRGRQVDEDGREHGFAHERGRCSKR